MSVRFLGPLVSAVTMAGLAWLATVPIAGQASPPASPATAKPSTASSAQAKRGASKAWTHPKTSWGDPDLRGIWTSMSVSGVPVERPKQFGDRKFLTDEEFAKRQADGKRNQAAAQQGTQSWWEWYGRESRLSSLVTAPADGRIPWKPEVLKEFTAQTRVRRGLASWYDLDLWERCLTRGLPVAMIPSAYNAGYRIMQQPGYVIILYEMFDIRVIPLGKPPVGPAIKQWFGTSVGRWDGNTLVVEATHFSEKTRGTLKANGGSPSIESTAFTGTGSSLRVVERFTRNDADQITYEGTVWDDTVFTGPWTLTVPLLGDDKYQMFEYACHEGNYFIPNLLNGVRLEEQRAAEATQKPR